MSKVHSRTSGQFKCEVTSDGPLFHTDIKEAQLLVVGEQKTKSQVIDYTNIFGYFYILEIISSEFD